MFAVICPIAALILAAFSHPKYRFIAFVVVFEFAMSKIAYNYFFLESRAENSSLIYVLYSLIQVSVLFIMYMKQTHFIIAALVFLNLVYNFLTILQHLHITQINFHDPYQYVVGTIMIMELLYLLGTNIYVSNYLRRNGYLDIDALDSLLLVWRRPINGHLVQGKKQ